MLSFSMNPQDRVMGVFTSGIIRSIPKDDFGRSALSEVVFRALAGAELSEDVNLGAYGRVCETTENYKKSRRMVPIVSEREMMEGHTGVLETVVSYVETNFDTIAESSEVTTLFADFIRLHEDLLIEEGVHLYRVVTLARQANEKAVAKLKILVEKYAEVKEMLQALLSNTYSVQVLNKLKGEFSC